MQTWTGYLGLSPAQACSSRWPLRASTWFQWPFVCQWGWNWRAADPHYPPPQATAEHGQVNCNVEQQLDGKVFLPLAHFCLQDGQVEAIFGACGGRTEAVLFSPVGYGCEGTKGRPVSKKHLDHSAILRLCAVEGVGARTRNTTHDRRMPHRQPQVGALPTCNWLLGGVRTSACRHAQGH